MECRIRKRRTYSLSQLAKIIDTVFRDLYVFGEEVPYLGHPDDDHPSYRQRGEDFSSILQILLGTYLNCHDELTAEIYELDDHDPRDGGESFYDDSFNYELNRYWEIDVEPEWNAVLNDLKYSSRFFSDRAKNFFSFVFENYDLLSTHGARNRRMPIRLKTKAGLTLHRARIAKNDEELKKFSISPVLEIGPPSPSADGRGGRMHAAGIAVLYCATDIQTCLAEMRPSIGAKMATIEMKTTRALRLLNFEQLERASTSKMPGVFHPDYFLSQRRLAIQKRLHSFISRPITPDKESDSHHSNDGRVFS
ncbi:MAG: RES family NAD+ phosphorylase [Herminiimonas sp.]|uniref:RES family NAD+ phosphorylase n=1 Tax=Herminiimonas sp. TaxID=1926289 RepID=UPI002716DFB8|nr:RES family NAD+ phosphorylase [Herminiimonas sp.]MDO9420421.1 RES family NAD+ phosphorylase [Herminiimonas sp.]